MATDQWKSDFKLLESFKTDYSPSELRKYESQRTGLQIVTIYTKGPKVNGWFLLGTEIFDDSGAPHTLEHLCFMGSKNYDYKGVLDRLATRAYSFTNAWTATDHTAYTLETAGWAGFAQILPVYLEHVLFPTLSDSACYTEVYHVDGEGKDAGEMQGVQNTSSLQLDLALNRILYPEGIGYRYETGGLMENLRVLTNKRIREFHKAMYQPKNLCLIIGGEVDYDNLLQIVHEFESGILKDVPSIDDPWQRPWIDSKQPGEIKETVLKTIEFPEEDESAGEIIICFFGPDPRNDLESTAINVLNEYLTGSSVAILENTLVQQEELASSIDVYMVWRPKSEIQFMISGVATEKLANVEKRFFEVLHSIEDKPLDLKYLQSCLHREKRRIVLKAESGAGFFSDSVIIDQLFGDRNGKSLWDLQHLKSFDILAAWTESEWKSFFSKWLIKANHISLLGRPSSTLADKLKAEEEARVAKRQEELGEEGLAKLAKQLEDAKTHNERDIPTSMFDKFSVPPTESIHFHPTAHAVSGLAKSKTVDPDLQKIISGEKLDTPIFLHFEHQPSQFVRISIIISAVDVPVELLPLIPVYLENFFNTPVLRNGTRIEFEQVVAEFQENTASFTADFTEPTPESFTVLVTTEREKYEDIIVRIKELLWNGIFDEKRLSACVSKILADIPSEKRDGMTMVQSVDSILHFGRDSTAHAMNTLVRSVYLKRLRSRLKKSPREIIIQFEKLRDHLCKLKNIRISVVSNLHSLKNPVSAWKKFTDSLEGSDILAPIDDRGKKLTQHGEKPGSLSYVVPLTAIDSSFSVQTSRGPNSPLHPQLPALMVAIAYLEATEGPLWCAVRGTGLAYGTWFRVKEETGFIRYFIYRSPDAYKAFTASKKIIEDFVSGATAFNPLELEGAVSSIVVGLVDKQTTMMAAAMTSFTNLVIKNLPSDYEADFLKKVRQVTVENIKTALTDFVLPLFAPETSDLFVTCAPIMQEDMKKHFEEAGYKPEIQPLSHFEDDYGLKAEDGETDEEDDDDDEMEDGDESEGDEDHNSDVD